MHVICTGFDTLDVAYKGRVSDEFLDHLEAAKEQAVEAREPVLLEYRGVRFLVRESGGRGYAFSCDGGQLLGNWSFKRPNVKDPWGIRVSAGSLMSATLGLDGTRERIEATLQKLGCLLHPNPESIGRVDFAIDVHGPGFELQPGSFVIHARSTRSDHMEIDSIQSHGHSGRFTSVTVGKMPGRQVIVYDKRLEAIQKPGKKVWFAIWNEALTEQGQRPLDFADGFAAAVWRIEVRAGKQCLKDRYKVTTWGDLADKLPSIYRDTLRRSRYCVPLADSNHSRWPDHELWRLAMAEVEKIDFDRLGYLDERSAVDICRRAQLEVIDQQLVGLAATRVALAANGNVPPDAGEMATWPIRQVAQTDASGFVERIQKATKRYTHLV